MDRREFMGKVLGGAAIAVTGGALLACDEGHAGECGTVEAPLADCGDDCEREPYGISDPNDLKMHGPVRQADEVLMFPAAPEAAKLFAPYMTERFATHWQITHVARGPEEGILVVVEDTRTGGHVEYRVYRRSDAPRPLGQSRDYSVFVRDGGRGDQKTPRHVMALGKALALVITSNERFVTPEWHVPSLADIHAQRVALFGNSDPPARLR